MAKILLDFPQQIKLFFMNIDLNNKLLLLKKSLKNLSKPYQEQVKEFPYYVDVFDEVVSDFDNAFRLLPILMEENLVPYNAVNEILKCNNLIELNLSMDEELTDESFEKDEKWNLVRQYAVNALRLMGNVSD